MCLILQVRLHFKAVGQAKRTCYSKRLAFRIATVCVLPCNTVHVNPQNSCDGTGAYQIIQALATALNSTRHRLGPGCRNSRGKPAACPDRSPIAHQPITTNIRQFLKRHAFSRINATCSPTIYPGLVSRVYGFSSVGASLAGERNGAPATIRLQGWLLQGRINKSVSSYELTKIKKTAVALLKFG